MKYSKRIKESVIRKVLPPENKSVSDVASEMGISSQTIYNWKRAAKNGTLSLEPESLSPPSLSRNEKFALLLEASQYKKDTIGKWLREKGLHSEHLNLWEQEVRDILKENDKQFQKENKKLKKETRELKKELARKDKALAEMAALVTLKKKWEKLLEESEDV